MTSCCYGGSWGGGMSTGGDNGMRLNRAKVIRLAELRAHIHQYIISVPLITIANIFLHISYSFFFNA